MQYLSALHTDQRFLAECHGRLVCTTRKRALYWSAFISVADLKATILQFIEVHNEHSAKPFKWNKTAEAIISTVSANLSIRRLEPGTMWVNVTATGRQVVGPSSSSQHNQRARPEDAPVLVPPGLDSAARSVVRGSSAHHN